MKDSPLHCGIVAVAKPRTLTLGGKKVTKIVKKARENHPGQYKYLVMDDNESMKYLEMKDGKITVRPEASVLSKTTIENFKKELEKLAKQ